MSARSKSIAEAAQILGCSKDALYDRRDGLILNMGNGLQMRLIRIGRMLRVPDIEIARFLGEAPPPAQTG